jgi:hypothetical protein
MQPSVKIDKKPERVQLAILIWVTGQHLLSSTIRRGRYSILNDPSHCQSEPALQWLPPVVSVLFNSLAYDSMLEY